MKLQKLGWPAAAAATTAAAGAARMSTLQVVAYGGATTAGDGGSPPQQHDGAAGDAAAADDDDAAASPAPVTLLLSPTLEQRFWQSVRLLKLLDGLGLFNSAMLNVMLIRKFGWGDKHPGWLWHFLPIMLYLTASSVQLCVLLTRPEAYQRHRFTINVVNRLVKAVTVTWAAVNMSEHTVMEQFAGTLNSVLPGAEQHSTATYMKILRTVASLPLLWASHSVNFILPFWLLLPLQLYTLLAVSRVLPSVVCALLGQPPHIVQAASAIAANMRGAARVLIALAVPVPLQWPWDSAAGAAGGAGADGGSDTAARDLLMMVTITFTTILLIVPCVVAYHVELLWKSEFLEAYRRNTQQPLLSAASIGRASSIGRATSIGRASSIGSGSLRPTISSPVGSFSSHGRSNSISSRRSSLDATAPAGKQQRGAQSWLTFDMVCMALLVGEALLRAAPAVVCECRTGASWPPAS